MRFLPLILFFTTIASGAVNAESPSARGISFEISKKREVYLVGQPISIGCVFRNNGSQPVTLSLKDHDRYHGTLAYPQDLQARVEAGDGKLLTANGIEKEGWWTFVYFSSQISPYEPGDHISIPPGDEVTRIVPLDEVLKGCDGLSRGLPAGHFVVQFRLVSPQLSVESNRLEITVALE